MLAEIDVCECDKFRTASLVVADDVALSGSADLQEAPE